ncbi:rhodanese-related sulfurtransferase [Saccharopolyspora lacisalsi]|uniref:Rhodanese-related sulfurtransferase n=1 Tax=Halosaccharopolyspora lacisalsi TaxID=1000566 RepID=A0A839DZJ8_9PSEU|nr:tyrosine-protein phosphatase [Halosaccharopolyspora lacisalsi]MBA8825676.1 rhodanese-related sulfurtransferase [Halosaccharopolyspora lacisalsi]
MTEQATNIPDELVNLRDLGGLPTEDEEVTATGVLYRSDAPHYGDCAPEGMAQWPPAAVVDLRDSAELKADRHPLTGLSTVYSVPVLEGLRSSPDEEWLSLSALYEYILEYAPGRILEIFRIAVETEGPVLLHCAAGKDRTGVASALLLRTAGVRPDAIVADYVRTDRNMYRVLQRLDQAPALPPGVEEEAVKELISAPTEAIETVLNELDGSEGGATGWLLAQGATSAEIERWRARFVNTMP